MKHNLFAMSSSSLSHIMFMTGTISRKSGGLFTSIRRLSQSVEQLNGTTVEVLSFTDRFTEIDTREWIPLKPKTYTQIGLKGFGFSPSLKKAALNSDADLLHLHGVWMYTSLVAKKWQKHTGRPVVISPRGMLDPWALRNSRWKKRIVGLLYANANLRSAACIHALCESEYQSIRAYGLKNPVAIIPNGVDLPNLQAGQKPPPWNSKIDKDKRVMLFLGRIHPKKGLTNLVKAWAIIKHSATSKQQSEWVLVIAGWDQGGHEKQLKDLVAGLGLIEDVIFLGPVFNDLKQPCFQNANAFILPSFSEGLPMSVLEAWSYGLPAIITRKCNIPEGFEAGAAIEIQPEPDSIAEKLKEFFGLHESAKKQIGQNGFELVKAKFNWPKIASQMVDVYNWVLGQSSKPDCVRLD